MATSMLSGMIDRHHVHLCIFRGIPSNGLPAHTIVRPLLLTCISTAVTFKTPPEPATPAPCSRGDVLVLTHGGDNISQVMRGCPPLSPHISRVMIRVNLTGGNRSGLTGYRSNRSGPVPVSTGTQPAKIQILNLNSKNEKFPKNS